MYQALILISTSLSFSMIDYQKAVIASVSTHQETAPSVTTTDDGFALEFSSGFTLSATYSCASSVLEESQEIAEQFAKNRQDSAEISQSTCRVEITTGPDFEMIHFNDFISSVEAAEKQGKVFAFDPLAGAFM